MTGLGKACCAAFVLIAMTTGANAQDSDHPTAVLHGAYTVDAFKMAAWQAPAELPQPRAEDRQPPPKNETQAELQQERQEKALNRRLKTLREE